MTLLALSLAWLAGVAAAARYGWDAWPLVPAAAVGGALLVARRPRSAAALPAVLLPLLLLAGLWRYQASLPSPASDDVARFNHGPPVSFRGVVEDEPELRDTSQRFRLRVQAIREGEAWRPASGAVLVTAGLFPRYRYGDLLELHGELQTPPRFSRFDYRDYLARRGVRALAAYPSIRVLDRGRGNPLREPLAAAREALGRSLARALPEPEASLARGIVLGQRSALPPWLEADLARTGTSHIVAVSGFNVTLVAGLTLGLLAPAVGRRRAVLAALLAVAAYTLLTGATPSVVRAAVMAALVLLAALAGRQSSAPVALAFAAALMTAADPGLIRDVGFQLSVAATAGLVLLAPPLAGLLWRLLGREEPAARTGLLRAPVEVAATTAAAYLATAPIAAVTFGSLSLVALAANLLVVPAFSAAFVLACLAALAGLAGLDAALLPGLAAWAPLHYTVEAVHRLARLPGAAVGLPPLSLSHAAALYTAAGLVWLTLRRGRAADRLAALADRVRRLLPPARLLGPAAAAALLVPAAWAAWGLLDRPEPALRVTFLDVGQGDAVLVRTPDGGTVLVDGGPSPRRLLEGVGRALPPWDRRIDLVVLTHPQADHLIGLVDLTERYRVGQVLTAGGPADSAASRAWADALRAARVPVLPAAPDTALDLGSGATLTVLAAGPVPGSANPNDTGVALRLDYGRTSVLLPGDREEPGLRHLLARVRDLRATVLAAPHHGARSAALPDLLAAVRPEAVVISVGRDNPFGHPHPETLAALAGVPLYRTDLHGAVTVTLDGASVRVGTERR